MFIPMSGTENSTKKHGRLGPYSRRLHRGAIGNLVDGRSAEGRFIRHLEAELIAHVGGAPTIAQRMLIDRAIKIRLQLDALDEKLNSDNWTGHDQRTYGALLNAQRLCLRELGPAGTARHRLKSTPQRAQFEGPADTELTLTPAQAYQAMLEGRPLMQPTPASSRQQMGRRRAPGDSPGRKRRGAAAGASSCAGRQSQTR
jgi:hypothetical protein